MSLTGEETIAAEKRLIGAIWFVLLAGVATIAAAWYFQLVLHYLPCELCLYQRIPYYVGLPIAALALLAAVAGASLSVLRAALMLIGLVFLVGMGLGVYHAGVEWSLWPGPTGCSGATGQTPASAGDLLNAVKTTRVVSCTEAAWRFLGISMAGWNALISALLALVAFIAVGRSGGDDLA